MLKNMVTKISVSKTTKNSHAYLGLFFINQHIFQFSTQFVSIRWSFQLQKSKEKLKMSKFSKTVETEYGPVQGVQKSSALGRDFFSFQGIPYMKAPLGKLRFRDAQPPENWVEPFDASKEPPSYCNSNLFAFTLLNREVGMSCISSKNDYDLHFMKFLNVVLRSE